MTSGAAEASIIWAPVMTDAGRSAIASADGQGLATKITHVVLGTGKYAVRDAGGIPTDVALEATALQNERLRLPVYAGGSPTPGALLIIAQVAAAASAADEFNITEVGFLDAAGTLLVVWSDTSLSLGYRSQTGAWNLQLGWAWRDMPADAITVSVVNAPLSDQLVRLAQDRALLATAVSESGLVFDPSDATALSRAIEARVTAAVQSLDQSVRQPIAITPADGSGGNVLAPLLRASSFASADGYTHIASQFVLANAAGEVFYDSQPISPVTEYQVPTGKLLPMTTYRWRVCYQGKLGGHLVWSAWSEDATFTTSSTQVAAPSIMSPSNGVTGVGPQPTLTSSAFAVTNGTDSHLSSQWQLSTTADFSVIAWDSGAVTTSLTSITVPASVLQTGTLYHARVRHTGSTWGASAWSAAVIFTTRNSFVYTLSPTISLPAAGATDVGPTPTILLGAFAVQGGTDTHQSTQIQIRLASGDWASPLFDTGEIAAVTQYVVPLANALPTDRDLLLRARYRGAATGWSAWSDLRAFHTAKPTGIAVYETAGQYEWEVPIDVFEVDAATTGAGAGASYWLDGTGKYIYGGAGGGYARKKIAVTPGTKLQIVIGKGGESGSVGGTSSVGNHISATGGSGWNAPGNGIGGDVNRSGFNGLTMSSLDNGYAAGGPSGGLGIDSYAQDYSNSTTAKFGSGGMGSPQNYYSGGNGVVVLRW